MDLESFKTRFELGLLEMISKQTKTSSLFTREEYFKVVDEINDSSKLGAKKTSAEYYKLRRYKVISLDGETRLALRAKTNIDDQIRCFVYMEEVFDILWQVHSSNRHCRRDIMIEHVKMFHNITRPIITLFIDLCSTCLAKKQSKQAKAIAQTSTTANITSTTTAAVASKPLIYNRVWSRCQLDLIDFQATPCGEYKFLMRLREHLTKFCVLRPLSEKTPEAVAEQLRNIFCLFGAPLVLLCALDWEFRREIVNDLKQKGPRFHMVHGKCRPSQCVRIKQIVQTGVRDHPDYSWAERAPEIQLIQNRTAQPGMKQSPIEALFGGKPLVGCCEFGVSFSNLSSFPQGWPTITGNAQRSVRTRGNC